MTGLRSRIVACRLVKMLICKTLVRHDSIVLDEGEMGFASAERAAASTQTGYEYWWKQRTGIGVSHLDTKPVYLR